MIGKVLYKGSAAVLTLTIGSECLCLGIEYLIKVKRAAGRPKDFEAIAELEAILEERQQANNQNLKANSSSQ